MVDVTSLEPYARILAVVPPRRLWQLRQKRSRSCECYYLDGSPNIVRTQCNRSGRSRDPVPDHTTPPMPFVGSPWLSVSRVSSLKPLPRLFLGCSRYGQILSPNCRVVCCIVMVAVSVPKVPCLVRLSRVLNTGPAQKTSTKPCPSGIGPPTQYCARIWKTVIVLELRIADRSCRIPPREQPSCRRTQARLEIFECSVGLSKHNPCGEGGAAWRRMGKPPVLDEGFVVDAQTDQVAVTWGKRHPRGQGVSSPRIDDGRPHGRHGGCGWQDPDASGEDAGCSRHCLDQLNMTNARSIVPEPVCIINCSRPRGGKSPTSTTGPPS